MMKKTYVKRAYWLISVVVVLMLALTACAPADDQDPALQGTPDAAAPDTGTDTEGDVPATGGVAITTATDPNLGEFLVDGNGMALYMFAQDEMNVSNCTGDCLTAWPPLVADGAATAGAGVDQAMIGSTDLADGGQIVTYSGMPLYYWSGDMSPGDINGQGVNDVWFLVSPNGSPLGMP